MKWLFTFLLVPTFSLAAQIPVEIFDQAKLETLLRNMPSSLVNTEIHEGFVRQHSLFPKSKESPFTIKCQADYFGQARVPSYKACELDILDQEFVGDEYLFTVTDHETVSLLRGAISYGDEIKKFHSVERVNGQAQDGTYRQLFRFAFICKRESCDITFATKAPKTR